MAKSGQSGKKTTRGGKAARADARTVSLPPPPNPLPDELVGLGELMRSYPILEAALPTLLEDKTPGYINRRKMPNIVWATDSYQHIDRKIFAPNAPITLEALEILRECGEDLRPRVLKRDDERRKRSKEHAEVFTPARLCAKMNDYLDQDWFGCETPVFTETDADGWTCVDAYRDYFDYEGWEKGAEKYLKSRRLEITCGEAPFIVSRYDAATGKRIPIQDRVGILDRKLRVIGGKKKLNYDPDQWLMNALLAFQSVYGYEYQGDSLLIARINVFITLVEYFRDKFDTTDTYEQLTSKEATSFANVIAWNFWQMNGLTCEAPGNPNAVVKDLKSSIEYIKSKESERTCSRDNNVRRLFDADNEMTNNAKTRDWQREYTYFFGAKNEKGRTMKFDYVIGNPPYQEEVEGNFRTRPVYNFFMDASYEVGDRVLLITPGRFLMRRGFTSEEWNEKMLADPHLKVLQYAQNSSVFFGDVDIKGGVAITYRDANKNFGAIEVYFAFDELKHIFIKVVKDKPFKTLADSIYPYNKWNMHEMNSDYHNLVSVLPDSSRDRLGAAVFTQVPIFTKTGGVAIISKLSV